MVHGNGLGKKELVEVADGEGGLIRGTDFTDGLEDVHGAEEGAFIDLDAIEEAADVVEDIGAFVEAKDIDDAHHVGWGAVGFDVFADPEGDEFGIEATGSAAAGETRAIHELVEHFGRIAIGPSDERNGSGEDGHGKLPSLHFGGAAGAQDFGESDVVE